MAKYFNTGFFFLLGIVVGAVGLHLMQPAPEQLNITKDDQSVATSTVENSVDKNGSDKTSTTTSTNPGQTQNGTIHVAKQKAGNAVMVSYVNMPADGWVVVHEVKNGVIANALGASWRPKGENKDVKVYLLRNTVPSNDYIIVLYNDDGDKKFELEQDSPFANSNRGDMMVRFKTE